MNAPFNLQPGFDQTTVTPTNERRGAAALKTLIKRLTDNYFDVSFDYGKPDAELKKEYERVFPKSEVRDFQVHRRCRNIIVIGAGTSFAAFGGDQFPLARNAIKRLKEYLGVRGLGDALRYSDESGSVRQDRLTEEEERLRLLTGIKSPQKDFESQLAIYSKFFTQRQLRGAIKTIYNHRYYPHIVFETIAHLLKHRFVDVVINYNFDELLDQAIEEELGGSEYRRVISDGDTDELARFVVDEQLKVPLYIKPHGTVSHKSSLRFTKDDYLGMPRDLQVFTRKILHGDTKEDPSSQRERFHVNLICIGFDFTSVELLHSLHDHPGLSVFHINRHGAMDRLEREPDERINAQHYFLSILSPAERDKVGDPGSEVWDSLEHLIRDIPAAIGERFDRLYTPRSLDRHEFIHRLLFRPLKDPQGEKSDVPPLRAGAEFDAGDWPKGSGYRVPCDQKKYHYARLCIEVALSLAKGNGRIDLTSAMLDRVGIYYKQWRTCETGEGRPLRDVCADEFRLEEAYGFSRTVYALNAKDLVTDDAVADSAVPDGAEAEEKSLPPIHIRIANLIFDRLKVALLQVDDAPFKEHLKTALGGDAEAEVRAFLARLTRSGAHDIAPVFDLRDLVLVTEPRQAFARIDPRRSVLHTSLSLTARFQELVRSDHWHLLLAITEEAKVLEKLDDALGASESGLNEREPVSRILKRASVIVADDPQNEALDHRLRNATRLLPGAAYRLPFWSHNNHMVIFLRMEFDQGRTDSRQWTPLRAIAYKKPALSTKVNPILVDEPNDLARLVTMYFGYVAKAEQYVKQQEQGANSALFVADDSVDVRRLQTKLLDQWWNTIVQDSGFCGSIGSGGSDPGS